MSKKTIEGQTYTNSIGMRFVRIEPGTFTMGSKNAALSDALTDGKAYLRDGDWDEQPVHQVTPHYAVLHRHFSGDECTVCGI